MALTRLDFFDRSNFAALVYHALRQVVSSDSAPTLLNGLYWAALPLVAAVNGFIVFRWVALAGRRGDAIAPLPIMAIFYAVVSVHFQIPVYLYYTVGLSLASLLWLAPRQSRFAAGASVALALVAVGDRRLLSRRPTGVEGNRGTSPWRAGSVSPCLGLAAQQPENRP